jgi:hypothetical protein
MARHLAICEAYREIELYDIPSARRVIVSFIKKQTGLMKLA